MNKAIPKRLLSLLLVLVMAIGLLPCAALATDSGTETQSSFVSETHTVFSSKTSTIAPGVTQSINYAYTTSDSKQMVYYVATADISCNDVVVQSSYKDAQCTTFGMAKLTEQMASATAKYSDSSNESFISEYYTAVAGINGDFYNMSTGRPSGAFVMDGVMSSTKANNYPWFAIFADGTALCGSNDTDWDAAVEAHGAVQQAVGGSVVLVKDGADVTASASGSYNTDRHSRTMVGVTADGKVVMAVVDGRQEPFSCGGTMHELAQIMLEQGCVMAINLDGGGSSTYAAREEGEDTVSVVNSPSDGSERSISSGLIIASTAVPSDTFDHATLTASDEYVTPGSSVTITAKGVSPAGTSAEIPDGVTYSATLGSVSADGVFTSDGTAGDAVVTMLYNGAEVGSVIIHVVVPDALSFDSSTITVPYGKTVELGMTATYGLNEVTMKAGDVSFELNDKIGTIDGFSFTAGEAGDVSSTTVTATFIGTELTATATIELGQGSTVLYNFEDQDVSNFYRSAASSYNYVICPGSCTLASAESGQVHSGNYSMKVECDFSTWLEGGYMNARVCTTNTIDLKGANRVGMWVYIPVEAASLNGRLFFCEVTSRNEDGSIKEMANSYTTATQIDTGGNWNVGFNTQYDESGWHYIYADLDTSKDWCLSGSFMDLYLNDRDSTEYGYNHLNYSSLNVDLNLYIDDITVDYSSAVEDREAPIFEKVTWADTSMSDAAAFTRGTVAETTSNVLSFGATVKENTDKSNYTGLDESTAKAYVDGVETACTISGGIMSVADVTLADGIHTIKFAICDKQGNLATVVRQINVQADSGMSTVKLVAHDSTLDKILLGSLYYVDLVATDIEKVQSISATLDLNDMSVWELDHMDVADGFEASYEITNADENIAVVTITRTESSNTTGEAALVSMPIRTWQLPVTQPNGGKSTAVKMYDAYRKDNELLPIDISVKVTCGAITFTDNSTDTFSGEKVQVDTESDSWFYNDTSARDDEYTAWNGGHDHRTETAQYYSDGATNVATPIALEDKVATCTEDGYTGRTYCETCQSIVDWGTTVPATGHSYAVAEDGVLKCTACGELYSGTWTDGKEYVDGAVASNEWVGDSYYVDGVKLTGIQQADGYYYDFGEDGVCEGKVVYTGFYGSDENGWQYIMAGQISKASWIYISAEDQWYYFTKDGYAATDTVQIDGLDYKFEGNKGKCIGAWSITDEGSRFYFCRRYYKNTWAEIDGEKYYFDNSGYCYTGTCAVSHLGNYLGAWEFDADGKFVKNITGVFQDARDGLYHYAEDGVLYNGGLLLWNGDYYYAKSNYSLATTTWSVSEDKANGLKSAGTYEFGSDAKMIIVETDVKNGVCNDDYGVLCYYINGVQQFGSGVIEIDGSYYYVRTNGRVVHGMSWFVPASSTNGFVDEGTYEFNDDGTMVIVEPVVKNGVCEDDYGVLCYYINGVQQFASGVIEINGSYYYVRTNGRVVHGTSWFVPASATNGLVDEGTYDFDTDGKMILEAE